MDKLLEKKIKNLNLFSKRRCAPTCALLATRITTSPYLGNRKQRESLAK